MKLIDRKNDGNTKTLFLLTMNDRLEDVVYHQFNVKREDSIVLKSYDTTISKAYGSLIRNILIAIYEENVREIYVIGEKGSKSLTLSKEQLVEKMNKAGIAEDSIKTLEYLKFVVGDDLYSWLKGNDVDSDEEKVLTSVKNLSQHPLIPDNIDIRGLIYDSKEDDLSFIPADRYEDVL